MKNQRFACISFPMTHISQPYLNNPLENRKIVKKINKKTTLFGTIIQKY